MTLQKLMIKKIDQYSGRELLVKKLEYYSKLANDQDQLMYDLLIVNINQLYDSVVDIERTTLKHYELSVLAVNTLKKSSVKYKCLTLGFLAELIEFNINYVTGVRKLA
ncbi:hypothetical protein [Seonamhaeicola sp.]|uniref:hypothetical protein n=1 Tax=Seonamhaeicola sp. TaxID=1912245 RepID=UPI00356346C4